MSIIKSLTHVGVALSLLSMGCLHGAQPVAPSGSHDKQVLFVGNSLTYTNDLPGVFQDLAIAGGYDVGVATIAYPNMALVDYLFDANAMKSISNNKWDYVVLQQGATSVAICRDTLVLTARSLDPLIRKNGGVPALMMTWPTYDRRHVFPNVHDSYALAAQEVDGIFLPVGDAWLEAWKLNPQLPLYSGDGLHPSTYGTYLAALVLYEKFTGKDARELPVDIRPGSYSLTLPADVVRLLQNAAHITNQLPVPKVVVPPTPVGPAIRC